MVFPFLDIDSSASTELHPFVWPLSAADCL
jgi:hypothetical protein